MVKRLLTVIAVILVSCGAFVVPQRAVTLHIKSSRLQSQSLTRCRRRTTSIHPTMVFSGGGILGVGTPEVLVICAVGYFLLGPSELYKLAKEIVVVITKEIRRHRQARQAVAESAAEWQSTMDAQFEFQELREVQAAARELQDAFNFRKLLQQTPVDRVLGSERYMNEWREYKNPNQQLPLDLLPPPTDEATVNDPEGMRFQQQMAIDDWNAEILKKEKSMAGAGIHTGSEGDTSLAEQKRIAFERIERVILFTNVRENVPLGATLSENADNLNSSTNTNVCSFLNFTRQRRGTGQKVQVELAASEEELPK